VSLLILKCEKYEEEAVLSLATTIRLVKISLLRFDLKLSVVPEACETFQPIILVLRATQSARRYQAHDSSSNSSHKPKCIRSEKGENVAESKVTKPLLLFRLPKAHVTSADQCIITEAHAGLESSRNLQQLIHHDTSLRLQSADHRHTSSWVTRDRSMTWSPTFTSEARTPKQARGTLAEGVLEHD